MFLADLFFVLNAVLPYYLATLLFSPSSFKYAPLGGKSVRLLVSAFSNLFAGG